MIKTLVRFFLSIYIKEPVNGLLSLTVKNPISVGGNNCHL